MKIKAAVLREAGQPVTIEDIDLEAPQAGEVLVKYVNTGFCHSDLTVLGGGMGPGSYPMVPGHEAAGVVEEVGPGVENVKKGDRVVVPWLIACGKCPECLQGKGNVCRTSFIPLVAGTLFNGNLRMKDKSGTAVSMQSFVSGFSTHQVVDAQGLVIIPDKLPLEQACFMGCCVPTGWGTVNNKADVQPGQSVAVFGCGGVGLNVIRAASFRMANPLIAVDLEGSKENIAREFGATHFINSSKEDPVPAIQKLTGGMDMGNDIYLGGGVDIAFEVIGDPGAYIQAFWSLGMSGKLMSIGVIHQDQTVNYQQFFLTLQDKSIIGSLYGSAATHLSIPRLSELAIRGDLKLDKLITKHFKLEEINEVAEAMRRREIIGRWVCDLD